MLEATALHCRDADSRTYRSSPDFPRSLASRSARPSFSATRREYGTPSIREVRRAGAGGDGIAPKLPAPDCVRHGVAERTKGKGSDLSLSTRRGGRAQHGGPARRASV